MITHFTKDIVSRIYASKAFLKAYRPLINRYRKIHGAVIVNFHQFYKREDGFIRKGPSVHTHVDDFEEILDLLITRYKLISLDTLVKHLENNKPLDDDSFVITMDDGYENNLHLGLPILEKYNVPATLYVATGFIGTNKLLPMDRVDYALRTTHKTSFRWRYNDNELLEITDSEKKRSANRIIGNIIKSLQHVELDKAFQELYRVLEVETEDNNSEMLNWDQVNELLDSGIDIGSHGVSHICMTKLDQKTAVKELYQSREDIKMNTDHIPNHFAFPNGMERDFNDRLRKAAFEAGYKSVASVVRGINTPGVTNPFKLKRVGMFDNPKRTLMYIENMFYKAQKEIRSISTNTK